MKWESYEIQISVFIHKTWNFVNKNFMDGFSPLLCKYPDKSHSFSSGPQSLKYVFCESEQKKSANS